MDKITIKGADGALHVGMTLDDLAKAAGNDVAAAAVCDLIAELAYRKMEELHAYRNASGILVDRTASVMRYATQLNAIAATGNKMTPEQAGDAKILLAGAEAEQAILDYADALKKQAAADPVAALELARDASKWPQAPEGLAALVAAC